eukprot:CAMPEP_0174756596 /NCGR_PEP_ID=MMETSP1094-20130205/106835_1 /TAXON_ID=156173 /ORGANISM="Chrysochromulina brevifilum, Strain UTEX LB 985" /LENGTH=287 /DNA_ID=CAMNT_0015962501 /DNA_START=33 /DNA_END=896 /DNA_ORIENTATION=+
MTRSESLPNLTAAEERDLEATLLKLPNKNRPSDYRWLEALLSLIALNTAPIVQDLTTQAIGTPMFVMAGACPSVFAGMQAVVFTAMYPPSSAAHATLQERARELSGQSGPPVDAQPTVDFWWLKPQVSDPGILEEATIHRHGKGTHKNDPGTSKKVYQPIASLFSTGGTSSDGQLRFGMLPRLSANGRSRAYIDCLVSGTRYVLCWVWLEDWSSPVSFGKKFMKGKLIYQRGDDPRVMSEDGMHGGAYFARPFKFQDSGLIVPAGLHLEEPVDSVLPSDRIKLGCNI